MNENQIIFKGKSFCFTGEMADIKRADAEKEVKIRGAYSSKGINRQLDYLVIGSFPNPAWKFGNYGNKINDATKLRRDTGKPLIINESEFIDALVETEPKYTGEVSEKLLFIRFSFHCKEEDEILNNVDSIIQELKTKYNLYTTKSIYDLSGLVFLFDLQGNFTNDDVLKVEYRLLKHLKATEISVDIINEATNCLNSINVTSSNFSFSEPIEGTSIFMRLLDELPANFKLERQ
jgi:hypothetical protein